MEAHLGVELCGACAEIKRLFDPSGVMNPGKIVDTGRFAVDRDLRLGPESTLEVPWKPVLGFVEKDHSFIGNLEQCNGCGGCRKDAPTMCPTFVATGEELLSTRGRANTIRATIEGRFDNDLLSSELHDALSSCLSCKACKSECPSGVDLAHLKAEVVHARHQTHGPSLADRVIAASDVLGRLACAISPLANRALRSPILRRLMESWLGIDAGRPLPPYAGERFDRWFRRRKKRRSTTGSPVVLWDDTWSRYHEPGIGMAATRVLEAFGYAVELTEDRRCCGRPAASRGMLDVVRRNAEHNVRRLAATTPKPVIFLEPSCWSMFVDEYRQLSIDGADELARRCVLFEDFMEKALSESEGELPLFGPGRVAVHGHCHTKALADSAALGRLLAALPGCDAEVLDTGCCGMAGAFGMMAANQELSRAVATPLVGLVNDLARDVKVVAAGTSCRHQIHDLAGREVLHPAELLAAALKSSSI
jgi:Fe-S oxidoreductase